ncbi:hypothetical protein CPB84DRAFT_1963064 [Gymnopilus junonius]|uniref:BTB domain-containing protein n=1 Tax=Gymnopilus junonius TaxID=109634 RepID=A0A9P5TL28_GYMJU|nr:hypothetical protein CPB84DRAFT_1963064 [Gymnopilus junonius]
MAESDSENVHPPKRPRLEPNLVEDECEEKQPVTRSKYWFETGDVILHVQNTQLRVHREILALHSTIFKDMFNMPNSKENVLDGPPVVDLDDEADDIEYMLSIFYDSVKKHDWSKPMRLVHVSALLRLGKKYEIDFFVEQALKCLRVDHPTSLVDWESIAFPDRYKKIESNGDDENDDMEDIIALANEHSVPSILPVAYLRLVLQYPLEIFISEETMPRLSRVDRDNCIVGRDKLSKELREKRTQ